MASRPRVLNILLSLALGWLSQAALAQDLMLFPPSSFGQVVAPQTEYLLGDIQLEAQVGDYNNEFVANYGEKSVFARTGRSVGMLQVLTNIGHAPCTAFLVDDNKLITNHHCVPGVLDHPKMKAQGASAIVAVQFHAGFLRDGISEGVKSFHVNPVPLETNAELDYSVLQVIGDANAEFGALELASVAMDDRAPLWVIGHPMGEAQRISREKCQADSPAIASGKLRHTCDTLPGNSGSPVIDPEGRKVVALHHAGSRAGNVNYAIPMADILRQSKVLRAAAAPAPVTPAPQADPCDPQFLLARQVDQCRVWEGYLASCASHAKAPEARRLRDMACKVDACDAAFDRVAAADTCADWSGFIESCPGHSGMIAARFGVQLRCEAKPDAPSAPEPVAEPQPGIATAPAPAPASAAAAAPESRASLAEVQRAARAALRARDYSEALRNYRQAADKGDATAQYMVGNFHFRGWGVVRDDAEALRWYRAAAAQGHKGAQLAVDRHATAQTTTAPATGAVTVSIPTVDHRKAPVATLATGSNVQVEAWYRTGKEHYARKAFVAALAEYEKAAAAGLAVAALDLGYMYQNGIGTERDIVQAVNYFHKAAERGNATGLQAMERVIAELTAKNPMQGAFWAVKYLELGGYAYAQKITDREVILRMQRILKGRGLYDGPLDGISGPRTLAAMRRLLPN